MKGGESHGPGTAVPGVKDERTLGEGESTEDLLLSLADLGHRKDQSLSGTDHPTQVSLAFLDSPAASRPASLW